MRDTTMTQHDLTPASLRLFRILAEDAGNWSGTPLWDGNFSATHEDRGNLTDLKVKGLVRTTTEDDFVWVDFTDEGKALAASLGIELD